MSDLREKLSDELLPAPWRLLSEHHDRGALFIVPAPLGLLEVAHAVATDQKDQVEEWLLSRALRRPTKEEAAAWTANPQARFLMVIVQPFVFAQGIEDLSAEA